MTQQLSNLTEREMLILLCERMELIETRMAAQQSLINKVQELELRLLELNTKIRVWATVVGFLSGLGGGALLKLIHF